MNMNQIDFLPESYRRTNQRRGRRVRQIMLVVIVVLVLIGTTVAMKTHTANLTRTAERLDDTVQTEQGSLGVLAMLKRERDELQKHIELQRDLLPAVSYSQVIAAISHALPEEIAIRDLVLRTVQPKPEPIETDAMREARLAQSARVKTSGQKPPVEPHLIGIELEGVSPSDLAVATLISTLDQDPLFSRVTMRSSRSVERHHLRMREFTLTATVDLDRRFEWTQTVAEVNLAR